MKHFLPLFCVCLLFKQGFGQSGILDNSFAFDGTVINSFALGDEFYDALELQADGKVVVAGSFIDADERELLIARYTSEGELDVTFNGVGYSVVHVSDNDDMTTDMKILPDGKILACGYFDTGAGNDFYLARLNTDGSPDNTFDGDGILILDFSYGDYVYVMELQEDGKIIIAGQEKLGTYSDFVVLRLNPDGTMDNTFGDEGKVNTALRGKDDKVYAIQIQEDGKIVAGGVAIGTDTVDFGLARYNTDGSLDLAFGDGGIVLSDFGYSELIFTIAIQNDGKILAAGDAYIGSEDPLLMVRYNSDGSFDETFGDGGKVLMEVGTGLDAIVEMVLQSDQKIVFGGEADQGFNTINMIGRFNTDGTPDLSFGTDGFTVEKIEEQTGRCSDIKLQPDNKIVTAGFVYNGTDYDAFVQRYTNDVLQGIGNEGLTGVMNIYPNPASEFISFDTAIMGNGKCIISDISGTIVVNSESMNLTENKIDISMLEPGIYIVSLTTDQRINSGLFVKLK